MKGRKWLLNGLIAAVFVSCFALGTVHAQPSYPDLTDWANNTWFKLTLTGNAIHYPSVGAKPNPSYALAVNIGKAYLNIRGWDAINHILTADIYSKDPNTGQWISSPHFTTDIKYFAGTALQFRASAQAVDPDGITMNLILVFNGKKNQAGDFILGGTTKISSMASNILDINDAGPDRWVGSVKVRGPMVPATSLPFTPTPP